MIKWKQYIRKTGVAAVAVVLFINGCKSSGINSTEALFAAMQDKLVNTVSFNSEVSLKLDMDYMLDDADDNMQLYFQEDITTMLNSKEVYVDGFMNVTDVYDEDWESYIVNSDGKYVSYSCVEDQWYYNEVEEESIQYGPFSVFEAVSEIEGYSFKNDKSYVMETQIGSNTVINILNCFYSNVIENAFSEGLDTENMTGTLILTVDKDTCLPESLEILFDDCADMFIGEEMFDDVNINEFVFGVKFSGYDNTDDIDVPVNIIELFEEPDVSDMYHDAEESTEESSSAVQESSSDDYVEDSTEETAVSSTVVQETMEEVIESDGEGFYELLDYQGIKSVKIKAPQGYIFNDESDNAMMFFDKQGTVSGGYCTAAYELVELSEGYTKEDIEGYIEALYNFYGTDEDYKDMEFINKQNIEINGFAISYSGMKYYYPGDEIDKGGYTTKYCYWMYVDNYAIICNITDYAEDGFTSFNAGENAKLLFEGIIV